MNRNLLLAFMAILLLSCNDDDLENPIPDPEITLTNTAHDWLPLAVGNYWIYQWYNKDSMGIVTYKTQMDSIYIAGDTLIEGIQYFKMVGSSLSPVNDEFIRTTDSTVVNHLGQKLFTPNEDNAFLASSETEHFTSEIFMIGDSLVNFEIGLLNCKYMRQDITWLNGISDCEIPGWHFWGKNIGPVRRELFWASSCQRAGHELIRYHIE